MSKERTKFPVIRKDDMSGREASFESVEAMDVELARLARAGGVLRLHLGAGFEALARIGGHHELGFSSLEAYALERCERSTRWVQESRALARRLQALPAVRRALAVVEGRRRCERAGR